MSRFFSEKYAALTPYTPGEQPRERKFVKLNTNESPFPPSPLAVRMAQAEAEKLQLYSDPECRDLIEAAVDTLGVNADEIVFTNGSDEILNFAFMAFCDESHPALFPDITYGFYKVFAELNGVPYREIPLRDDFSIDLRDYVSVRGTKFIANPNAPTGIVLSVAEIERIVSSSPNDMVIVDEAYVDFGAESAVPLTRKYDNLLVTRTFSKSRSLAGARLGFGIASPSVIRDLNTVRYSTNPYNVNRMTMAAGVGALKDAEYFESARSTVIENRAWTAAELEKLGFTLTDSLTNFIFAKHKSAPGADIYAKLKENGILVRHFDTPRLKDYNRITIGSAEEMKTLVDTLKIILK